MLREDIAAILAKGASGSLAVSVASTGVGFLATVALARLLGVEEYGIYVYILSWIGVISLVAQLGFRPCLVRFVAQYTAQEQWGFVRGVLSYTTRVSFIASVAVCVIASAIAWLLQDRGAISNLQTFLVALPLIPLITLAGLRASALNGLKRVVLSAIPDSTVRPALIASAILIIATLFKIDVTALDALIVNICATFIVFLIGTLLLINVMPKQVRRSPPLYERKLWWRTSLPMFFSSGMNQIMTQADIIMVGAILGAKEAGIYAIASRLAQFTMLGKQAADSITAPMISELYSTAQLTKLHRLVIFSARGVTVFTLLAAGMLVLLGSLILQIFGEGFSAGHVPLTILLVGYLFKASFASAGFLLSMTGHQDQSAMINGFSAVTNLVLNAILIPIYGLNGAALATAIASAIHSLLLMFFARKLLGISPHAFATLPDNR